ncbi:MAG TPA: DNA polymerase III subunit delta [Buchnera sp. (in: enterobacteria)]|nr:DNA polymerase III subunit delta [Buchnera sp. (in: enterobacteria)]
MCKIDANDLEDTLLQGLNTFYLLIGKEEFFIQESKDILLKFAKKEKYFEKIVIYIKSNKDWKIFIDIYQDINIFSEKKIIILIYKKDKFDEYFFKNLITISKILNKNVLLILQLENHQNNYKKKNIFYKLKIKTTIICCNPVKSENWSHWVNKKIKKMQLNINFNVKLLLYNNYENNLFALSNVLNIFKLLYPHTEITLDKSTQIIENLSFFTPRQWINTILEKNNSKSLKIIDRLYKQKYNPIFLIRILQKELLILIHMKRNKNINYHLFLNDKKICHKRHITLINACANSTNENLYKMIKIITNLELKIKEEYSKKSLWTQLKLLSLQF